MGFLSDLLGKKNGFTLDRSQVAPALASIALQYQRTYIDGLAEFGSVDPVEAFALAVFTTGWTAASSQAFASLPSKVTQSIFDAFYEEAVALGRLTFNLDESGVQHLAKRVEACFKEFDAEARRAFRPGATNQFSLGEIMMGRLIAPPSNVSYAAF